VQPTPSELAQDDARTKRLFIQAFMSAAGLNDQTYANQDATATNPTGQYLVGSNTTGYAVEGQPRPATGSTGFMGVPPGLLLILGAILVIKALA
jgi:hypothetical protein